MITALALLVTTLFASGLTADVMNLFKDDTEVIWHTDSRRTPKLIINPNSPEIYAAKYALEFLKDNHDLFDLPQSVDNLSLIRTQESLLGTHYTYQQIVSELPLDDARLIISVSREDGKIYQIFNDTFPVAKNIMRPKSIISKDQAYDIAWENLKVHGSLMQNPSASLQYRYLENKLAMVYVTYIPTSAPFGYFEYIIDAVSGKILAKRDTAINYRKKSEWITEVENYSGPISDRKAEFKKLGQKAIKQFDEVSSVANGSGLVFDPDPRTTLNDRTLQNDSPANMFDAAYILATLKDISLSDSQYTLKGPWVEIADFESPHTPPSTTADGKWSAKRGDHAFNDVMTYYHIDRSQRYMQSLGYTGQKGIQYNSIKADSDGLDGDDNSHYVPSSNQLAFGQGCVPDNEDADVIYHEYGHAIQNSINRSFTGGDTGAIGEGFGDYWAGSYSTSTKNGLAYYPNEVFSWDAHGDGNPCWPGRSLNATEARYDHSRNYGAHTPIENGVQSDELWSTPLFQSLLDLLELGFPREDSDKIVLESHFGLGGNIKMRDLAQSTVRVARALFPNGPHASIFEKHFVLHNILELPKAALNIKPVVISNAGRNGFADPGETISLSIPVQNSGALAAKNIRAELVSSSASIKIVQGTSTYSDIAPSAEGKNATEFKVTVGQDLPCGGDFDLTLKLTFDGGPVNAGQYSIKVGTGASSPNPGSFSASPQIAIPDNSPAGTISTINIRNSGTIIKASGLSVNVDIAHTYQGDLVITLISPKGTKVLLHNKAGSGNNNIVGNYPGTLIPAQPLSKLAGESLDGDWKLEVVDTASDDTGTLKSWGLNAIFDHICEQASE